MSPGKRGHLSQAFVLEVREARANKVKQQTANQVGDPVEDPVEVPAEGRAQPKEVPSQASKPVEGWYLDELERKIKAGELPPFSQSVRPWHALHEEVLRMNHGVPMGMPE